MVCEVISNVVFKSSLVDGLKEQIIAVAGFAFLGFIVSVVSKYIRYLKVKKRYGESEDGYRLNNEETNYIRSLDQKNNEIVGVNKIKWEEFPKAMEIKDNFISIKSIDDIVSDVKDALDN